jgi:hypothetical protein
VFPVFVKPVLAVNAPTVNTINVSPFVPTISLPSKLLHIQPEDVFTVPWFTNVYILAAKLPFVKSKALVGEPAVTTYIPFSIGFVWFLIKILSPVVNVTPSITLAFENEVAKVLAIVVAATTDFFVDKPCTAKST